MHTALALLLASEYEGQRDSPCEAVVSTMGFVVSISDPWVLFQFTLRSEITKEIVQIRSDQENILDFSKAAGDANQPGDRKSLSLPPWLVPLRDHMVVGWY